MTRAEYHKKMVGLLRPSKGSRSSGIYNPRTGKYYSANYALQPRARKNRHFVRNLAEAHDRAKARGVKVPRERYVGGGYKIQKPPRGYAHIGKALVTFLIWGGRDSKGKIIDGASYTAVVPLPPNNAKNEEELRELVLSQIHAFRFKLQMENVANQKRGYVEEIGEAEIISIQYVYHDKKIAGVRDETPF